jgi:membrane-anchored glycerophosphoryl diester phosphodiesterase (GDPDase)
MNYISTTSIIKRAWETVKANLLTFVAAAAVLFVINVIFNAVTSVVEKNNMSLESGVLTLTTALISLIIGVAVTTALVRIARGAPVTMQALSISLSHVLRFVGVNILIGLIMLALVIPVVGAAIVLGITSFAGEMDNGVIAFAAILIAAVIFIVYVGIRLSFAKYAVLDGTIGIVEALKKSWNITSGHIWTIVKLGLLSMLVVLLGALALLIGLFVAVPVVALAGAYLYVELSSQKEQMVAGVKNNE